MPGLAAHIARRLIAELEALGMSRGVAAQTLARAASGIACLADDTTTLRAERWDHVGFPDSVAFVFGPEGDGVKLASLVNLPEGAMPPVAVDLDALPLWRVTVTFSFLENDEIYGDETVEVRALHELGANILAQRRANEDSVYADPRVEYLMSAEAELIEPLAAAA